MYSVKPGFVYRSVNGGDWTLNYGRPNGKEEFVGIMVIDDLKCAVFDDGIQQVAQSLRFAEDLAQSENLTSEFRRAA